MSVFVRCIGGCGQSFVPQLHGLKEGDPLVCLWCMTPRKPKVAPAPKDQGEGKDT